MSTFPLENTDWSLLNHTLFIDADRILRSQQRQTVETWKYYFSLCSPPIKVSFRIMDRTHGPYSACSVNIFRATGQIGREIFELTKTYVNSPSRPPPTLLYFPGPFSFFRSSYTFLLPVMFLRSQNSSCDPHCLAETKRLWLTRTESKAPLRGNTPNQTAQENFPSGRNPPRREHRQTSTQRNKDLISRVRHPF